MFEEESSLNDIPTVRVRGKFRPTCFHPYNAWNKSYDNEESSSSDEDDIGWWQFETRRNPYMLYSDLPARLRATLGKEERMLENESRTQ